MAENDQARDGAMNVDPPARPGRNGIVQGETRDREMNLDTPAWPWRNDIGQGEVSDLHFGGMRTDLPTPPGRDDILEEEEVGDADIENGPVNLHPPAGPGRNGNDHHNEENRSEEPGSLNVEEIETTVEGTVWNIRLGNTDPSPPSRNLYHIRPRIIECHSRF